MRVVLDSGEVIDLGITETAPTIGITDYSRRVTDDFGVTTVVERGFARRMSVRLAADTGAVDALQRRLADLRATPVQWVADDRFESLSIRGFYKEFALDLAVPPISYCTLSVEGLTDDDGAIDAGGDPAPEGQPSTLQLLQPVIVNDARLLASSVAEADAPEWSAAVAYPSGVRVIKAAVHRIYESVAAVSAGDDPAAASGKWLDVGPTNRWAMFDQALGSVTSAEGAIVVTLDVGAIDSVALLDVSADTVRVQAPGYDRTTAAGAGTIPFLDLQGNAGQVTVTIAGGGTVSVGTLLAGHRVSLGLTEASPSAGITDYSRKVVDDFGAVTIVQRSWAKKMAAKALIRTDAIDAVASRIAAVRAVPSLWIGQAGLDSLTVYGFFKDFSIEVGETFSKLSLSIEGLSTAGKVEPLKTTFSWPEITDPLGTKPTDNADETGKNTAADTHAVGGRPAADVNRYTDTNALGYIAAALRQDDYERAAAARTYVNGQSVSTYLLEFRNEQRGVNSAINSSLRLLGAKTADATAWVLDLDSVQVGGGKTLAQKFTEVGYDDGDVQATIQDLKLITSGYGKDLDAFDLKVAAAERAAGSASGDVATLKKTVDATVKLTLTNNGYISGYRLTNDGAVSSMTILADKFAIISDDNGTPIAPFQVVGKTVYIPSLTATTISYESLVQRFTDVGQQNLDPAGWYQMFPGGMIMQGGRVRRSINGDAVIPVTFPRPFPSQVLAVGTNGFLSVSNRFADIIMQNLGEPTLSGCNFQAQATGSDVSPLQGMDWWAWGR